MRYNKQIDLVGDSASKRLVVKNIYGLFLKSFFMKKRNFSLVHFSAPAIL